MNCLHPIPCWKCGEVMSKSDGIISPHLVFSESVAFRYYAEKFGSALAPVMLRDMSFSQPCGHCPACEMEKRKQMICRLSHESTCHDDVCCFITLTYDERFLPVTDNQTFERSSVKGVSRFGYNPPFDNETLFPRDVQGFLKRLRRHLEYLPDDCLVVSDKGDSLLNVPKRRIFQYQGKYFQRFDEGIIARDHLTKPIRYYAVGEYGSKFKRPHYHILIFGWRPSDLKFYKLINGHPVYRSPQVEKLWTFGFSTVEDFGAGTAKYISRYVTKKFVNLEDSHPDCICPEFALQSVRNGGIGALWFDKNYEAMFRRGFAYVKTGGLYTKYAIPKYYWYRCRKQDPCLWLELREQKLIWIDTHQTRKTDIGVLMNRCEKYAYDEHQRLYQSTFHNKS